MNSHIESKADGPQRITSHMTDLLRHTLGFSPRVKLDKEVYQDSAQVIKRNRLALQPDSDKKTESDKESTSTATTKGEL